MTSDLTVAQMAVGGGEFGWCLLDRVTATAPMEPIHMAHDYDDLRLVGLCCQPIVDSQHSAAGLIKAGWSAQQTSGSVS